MIKYNCKKTSSKCLGGFEKNGKEGFRSNSSSLKEWSELVCVAVGVREVKYGVCV